MSEESDAEMHIELRSKSALNGPAESGIEAGLAPASDHPGGSEIEDHAAAAKATHHPSENSPWPIVLALGLLLLAVGMLNQLLIAALGVIAIMAAIIGWLWQPWVS